MTRKSSSKKEKNTEDNRKDLKSKAAANAGVGVTRSISRYWIWLPILVAALIRLAYYFQFSRTPFARHLFLDSAFYDHWAEEIRRGAWMGGDKPFFVEPGYAYLLAILKLLGGGVASLRVVQAFVGICTVYFTARITRLLTDNHAAALAAGLITALYIPLIYFEGLVLKTTLEVFLTISFASVILHLKDRGSPYKAAGIGIFAGFAFLFRSTFLAVAVASALWTYRSLAGKIVRPWLPPVLMMLGLLLVVGAVSVRNHAVAKEWTALPYNSGINFYIGNGKMADGAMGNVGFIRYDPKYEEEDARSEAERRAGRQLSASEVSGFWWREGWADIANAPLRWSYLLLKKAVLFWNHYEITDNLSIYFVREFLPILRWPVPGFWLAGPIGLAGIAFAFWKKEERASYLSVLVLLQMASITAFHFAERYRLAAVPIMIVLGAAASVDVAKARGRAAPIVLGALAVGIILAAVPNPVYPKGQLLVNHHAMLGVAYKKAGRAEEALEQFDIALSEKPDDPSNTFNMGLALEELKKDPKGAEDMYRRTIRLKPNHGEAYGKLGHVLAGLGRPVEGAEAYIKAAELGYDPGLSYINAAAAFGRSDHYAEADAAIERGMRLRPNDAHGLEILGNIHFKRGDPSRAVQAWRRSLELEPDNPSLRKNLEILLKSHGAS